MRLQQDASEKLTAFIDESTLTEELIRFFRWRTPTKRYKSFIHRFKRLGTADHDAFIKYLHDEGY